MEHLTWSKHSFHNGITNRPQYLYQVPFSTQTQEDLPPPKQRKTFQYQNKGRKQTFQPTKEENKMPALKKRKKTKLPAHKQRRKTKLPALCLLLRLFVGSAWSFVFFHPRYNGQWPPTSKEFLSQILSITFYLSYLNS